MIKREIHGAIEFRDVDFSYPDRDNEYKKDPHKHFSIISVTMSLGRDLRVLILEIS